MAVIVLAVLGLGAYGYYDTNIRPGQEAVVRVGDRDINMGLFERRLAYLIHNSPEVAIGDARTAVQQVLEDVVTEEVNRQGAAGVNIFVSEEEIDADIRQKLRIPETADSNVYAEAYRDEIRNSGLNPNEYRQVIAARLLEEKLRQQFRDQIPATLEQIRLRRIAVDGEEAARKVIARLQAGEDFAALAAELSLDPLTKGNGGEMEWAAKGSLPPEVDVEVFPLDAGQLSEPLPLQGWYYVYQVLEKAADREVTPVQRQQIEERSYSQWQIGVSEQVQVVYYLDQDQVTRLLDKAVEEGLAAPVGQQP